MIKINNLDFAYNNTQVFKNISLEFEKGNIYGLWARMASARPPY